MSTVHKLAGRVGGLTRWSQETDRSGATKPARDAFLRKFEHEADPEAARRLHMAKLSLKRWQKRKKAA